MDLDKLIEQAEKRSHQKMDKRLKTMLKLILADIEKNIRIKFKEVIHKEDSINMFQKENIIKEFDKI